MAKILFAIIVSFWLTLPTNADPWWLERSPPAATDPIDQSKNESFWHLTIHDPVALSTVLVALFTAILGVGTFLLVLDGRRHSRHALRAYIGIDDGYATWDQSIFIVSVSFKNSGATPAYECKMWFKAAINNVGQPFAQTDKFGAPTIVGPGQQLRLDTQIQTDGTALQSVAAGAAKIYVWGRVEYRDAFKIARYFHFRCTMTGPPSRMVRGNDVFNGWGLAPDSMGYDAN